MLSLQIEGSHYIITKLKKKLSMVVCSDLGFDLILQYWMDYAGITNPRGYYNVDEIIPKPNALEIVWLNNRLYFRENCSIT